MRTRAAGAFAGLALATAFAAYGQQSPPPPPAFAPPNLSEKGVRAMAWNCAACHGTNGREAPGSAVPGLAGRLAGEIVEAMAQFKEGKRAATLMHQIAKGYSDAEIAAMADYFSKQPR
jgi:cytochrome subunit of sulfide dehydrogenase